MKTSVSQFDMLVTFMEQNGDLSKPSGSARGKLRAMQNWEELGTLLNSDASGEPKTVDKWKKVWSDLKNNTKKKAARINRAASGTGGGPALQARLSDLEQRVLNIIGPQAATGLAENTEAGFSQAIDEGMIEASPPPVLVICTSTPPTPPLGLCMDDSDSPIFRLRTTESPAQTSQHVDQPTEEWNRPGPSRQPHFTPPALHPNQEQPAAAVLQLHTAPLASPTRPRPATAGQTTPRRHPTAGSRRSRTSPRRRAVPPLTAVERATQEFLHSDSEWRKFLSEKSRRDDENEKERLQLRAIELRVQEQWQEVFCKALTLLEKFLEKNK